MKNLDIKKTAEKTGLARRDSETELFGEIENTRPMLDQDGTIAVVNERAESLLKPTVHVAYAKLKESRDNGRLVSGQTYRIIDYAAVTSQSNTYSANHKFDIVVTATGPDTLGEDARAVCSSQEGRFLYITDPDVSEEADPDKCLKYEGTIEYDGDTQYLWRLYTRIGDPHSGSDNNPLDDALFPTLIYAVTNTLYEPGSVQLSDQDAPVGWLVMDGGELVDYPVTSNSGIVIVECSNVPKSYIPRLLYKTEFWTHDEETGTWVPSPYKDEVDEIEFYAFCSTIEVECRVQYLWAKYSYIIGNIFAHVPAFTDYYIATDELPSSESGLTTKNPMPMILLTCDEDDFVVYNEDQPILDRIVRAEDGYDGDSYFMQSNLSAWRIKYCLDNDTSRFAWASPNGKGVVYYMKDEWENEAWYDFKNIQFKRKLTEGVYDESSGDDTWVYTFTLYDGESIKDASTEQFAGEDYEYTDTVTRGNRIGPYFSADSRQTLNDIVFLGLMDEGYFWGPHGNRLGDNCHNCTFGSDCSSNKFGDNCYDNVFGHYCQLNVLGAGCYSNTLSESSNNLFGDNCGSNALEDYSDGNSFGDGCSSNTLSYAFNNSFGPDCANVNIGEMSSYNVFGPDCDGIWFGEKPANFSSTTQYAVGDLCWYNGNVYRCKTAHQGSWNGSRFETANGDVLLPMYSHITFEGGSKKVFLTSTATSGDYSPFCNIDVAVGLSGSDSAPIVIEDSNSGQNFKTTYKPANSLEISI